jgi:hypothetical protein
MLHVTVHMCLFLLENLDIVMYHGVFESLAGCRHHTLPRYTTCV